MYDREVNCDLLYLLHCFITFFKARNILFEFSNALAVTDMISSKIQHKNIRNYVQIGWTQLLTRLKGK